MKDLYIAHWLISIMGAAFFGIVTYIIMNWFYEGRREWHTSRNEDQEAGKR